MLPFDLSNVNPETVDAVAEAGGLIPVGKYHVRVDGASPYTAQGGNGGTGTELEYHLLAGPFKGKTIKDTIWDPSDAQDEDKRATTQNRWCRFAHRLGLIGYDPKSKRYVEVPGKDGFTSCLGKEVVIEVNHRKFKRKDGSDGTAAGVSFGGIWDLGDPKVKDVVKAAAGSAPPPSTAPATNGKKKVDVSDL